MENKKRKVVIWGNGKYYDYKKSYLQENYNIIGIVSKFEKEQQSDGYKLFAKEQLATLDYDKIIIMSDGYMFEILKEILELGIAADKIELGVNLPPATEKEVLYISPEEKLEIREDGVIVWDHRVEITCPADIEKAKKLHIGEMSDETIRNMPLKPLSYNYGASRGHSIARYYIDEFVKQHKEHIKGNVMEIGDDKYSRLGAGAIEKQQILILDGKTEGKYVKGNLETGEGMNEESVDCFILTNVLSSLFEVEAAAKNIGKSLKKGGKAIITVPGIAALYRVQNETYGQFWRFTPSGLDRLLKKCIPEAEITIKVFGNAKTSAAFLYGLTVEDLTQEELEYCDSCYPLVLGALVER